MTDNLKTWSENIYLDPGEDNMNSDVINWNDYIESDRIAEWYEGLSEGELVISYIRYDIAAEREAALIRLARQGIIGFYKNSAASVSDEELYEAAGLEKLK